METTSAPTPVHSPEIVARPAGPDGSLAAFIAECPCGLVIGNTVRSNVEFEIREHAAYMAARGR